MKNDEIKEANRKALPKFLLFAVVCAIVGGVIGYYSGYGAAKGVMDELVGMMKETGAFFGTHIAPWLMVAIAIIVPVLCLPIYRSAKKLLAAWDGEVLQYLTTWRKPLYFSSVLSLSSLL